MGDGNWEDAGRVVAIAILMNIHRGTRRIVLIPIGRTIPAELRLMIVGIEVPIRDIAG